MQSKFKVGDKVKVLSILGVDSDDYPEIVGKVFTVVNSNSDYPRGLYQLNNCVFSFNDDSLELDEPKAQQPSLNGHIWLIVNKKMSKVVEGFETRNEARFSKSFYDFPENFKIVKYIF